MKTSSPFHRFTRRFLHLLGLVLLPLSSYAGLTFDQTVIVVPCEAGQNVIKAEIPFKTQGDKAFSITQIKTSCNCTTGVADAAEYKPGITGKILVTFTVGERTGLQRKTITVKTSDGQEQVAFFQTTIPSILEITPAFVLWRKGESADTKEIQIKTMLDQPVQILGTSSTADDAFTVEVTPREPGKLYTLKITPKATDKTTTARIVLKTDFPKDDVERFVVVAAIK